jgi:hypothetical protein
MAIGALIGIFFGLVFGGSKGKWLDYVYGSELPCDGTKEPANSAQEFQCVIPCKEKSEDPV